MAVEDPVQEPVSVLHARARARYWLFAAWLVGSVSYGFIFWYSSYLGARSTTRWGWPAFVVLFLALAVQSLRRGVVADTRGVVVRNLFRRHEIAWSDLSAINFRPADMPWISAIFYRLVFLRQDGSRVTADAPGGGKDPGESLFILRERLLAMQQAMLNDSLTAVPSERPATDPASVAKRRPLTRVAIFLAGAAVIAATFVAFNMFRGGEPTAPETPVAAAEVPGTTATPTPSATVSSDPPAAPSPTSKGVAKTPAPPLIKPKRVYWERLKRTMCVRVPAGQAFQYLTVVDCRAPHEEEVTARGVIPGTSKWPGDSAVDEAATKQCKPAFATYVGVAVEDSRLDFDYFTTDAAGWKTGPHILICLVYDPFADHLTKSVRNARE